MTKIWKIAPGNRAKNWEVFHNRGCIGVGWLPGDDYQRFETQDQVLQALAKQHGKNAPGYGGGAANMIRSFVNDIQPGHVVVANKGLSELVGIGVVTSSYLPPTSPDNPMLDDKTTHRHHSRRVNWIVTRHVDLKDRNFFVRKTISPLATSKVDKIRQAYLDAYPGDVEIRAALERLFGDADDTNVHAIAEAERQLEEVSAFDPTNDEDARERVLSSIVRRRGQSRFRNALLAAYNGRCAITGCAVEAVLEAAHIIPYKGVQTNHVGNGLLLRGDWHTLFDLRLVTVDSETMTVVVSPKLRGTGYDDSHGEPLRMPEDPASWPSKDAIKQHQHESGLFSSG